MHPPWRAAGHDPQADAQSEGDAVGAPGGGASTSDSTVGAVAPHLDPDTLARAHAALDEHWALRSLRRTRREQILAAAEQRRDATGADAAVAPSVRVGKRRTAAARGRTAAVPAPSVTDADILHLAGAYDLAGRDAVVALRPLREEAPPPRDGGVPDAEDRRTLRAQLVIAAARAFALQTSLPLDSASAATSAATSAAAPPRDAADASIDRADAAEALLHRLLYLAALAEVGHRRADWLRWLGAHEAALADRLGSAAVPEAAARAAESPAPAVGWELRFRSLVVGAWLQLLRRSGPSGLDDAMALLARIREERPTAEPAWLDEVARSGGELALVHARFRLFALAHVADAAVDTLLYLRHGPSHATALATDRAVQLRLNLAREAGAGDVQLDGVLTWLREAARHVIARGSPQLEIAVGS